MKNTNPFAVIGIIGATVLGLTSWDKDNIHDLIANYENSIKYEPYYKPLVTPSDFNDEMTEYVQQAYNIDNQDPGQRAKMAIGHLSAIARSTINLNNQVANAKTTDVLVDANPLNVGLKYASNWSPEKMAELRKLSEQQIALKNTHPLTLEQALEAQSDFSLIVHKYFEDQVVYKPTVSEYVNYYDRIEESL